MKLRLRIIKAALLFINIKFIGKISFDPLKDYLSELLQPLKKVIDKLTDKDPDNKKQLKELWEEIKGEIENDSLIAAVETIKLKVKDKEARELLILILEGYIDEQKSGQVFPAT